MTSTEEKTREVLQAYRNEVETPSVSVIYARAHQQAATCIEPRHRRMVSKGAVFGALALGVGLPATAVGAVVAIHHFVDQPSDPLKGLNPNSKFSSASPSALPPKVIGNTEKVPGGYVQLTVQPGTVAGRSCNALVQYSNAGGVISSISACGGGGGVTSATNVLGVSEIYTDDAAAARVVVQTSTERYERALHAKYAIAPQLPSGPVTITTYRANGSLIAVHHADL